MTIKIKPLKGTSRTLAEWKAFACRDDCLDRMVPSDLRCILSAIEPTDPSTIRAEALRDKIAAKAREYAEHYPQSSDGRNTFLMFAEWVESIEAVDPATIRAEALRELAEEIGDLGDDLTHFASVVDRGLHLRAYRTRERIFALIDKEKDQ